MDREEVIRMAKEAANGNPMSGYIGNDLTMSAWAEVFERFAGLVGAAERERCAKSCESLGWGNSMAVNPMA